MTTYDAWKLATPYDDCDEYPDDDHGPNCEDCRDGKPLCTEPCGEEGVGDE